MNYLNQKKEVQCPLCHSKKSILLFSVSSSVATQHFILKEQDQIAYSQLLSHIENIWGKSQCEVIKCLRCDFIFSNPYISGDQIFYNLAYPEPGYPKWKWEFEFSYQILKKNKTPDPNILEIGAGQGSFVEKISQGLIKKENIVCTEYSKYGRGKISKIGIQCFDDDIRNIDNKNFVENFDFIFMFQVLEHMNDLDRLFQKLTSIIKKGGNLIISVPNDKWIEFNELNGALLDMPPNHIGRWNEKSFKYLAEKYNLLIKQHEFEPYNIFKIILQFSHYKYLKNSQNPNSIENNIERMSSKLYYRAIKILGIIFNLVKSIPVIVRKYNLIYGDSQIVHLVKR